MYEISSHVGDDLGITILGCGYVILYLALYLGSFTVDYYFKVCLFAGAYYSCRYGDLCSLVYGGSVDLCATTNRGICGALQRSTLYVRRLRSPRDYG